LDLGLDHRVDNHSHCCSPGPPRASSAHTVIQSIYLPTMRHCLRRQPRHCFSRGSLQLALIAAPSFTSRASPLSCVPLACPSAPKISEKRCSYSQVNGPERQSEQVDDTNDPLADRTFDKFALRRFSRAFFRRPDDLRLLNFSRRSSRRSSATKEERHWLRAGPIASTCRAAVGGADHGNGAARKMVQQLSNAQRFRWKRFCPRSSTSSLRRVAFTVRLSDLDFCAASC